MLKLFYFNDLALISVQLLETNLRAPFTRQEAPGPKPSVGPEEVKTQKHKKWKRFSFSECFWSFTVTALSQCHVTLRGFRFGPELPKHDRKILPNYTNKSHVGKILISVELLLACCVSLHLLYTRFTLKTVYLWYLCVNNFTTFSSSVFLIFWMIWRISGGFFVDVGLFDCSIQTWCLSLSLCVGGQFRCCIRNVDH